jgi:hypothetical protein
MSGKLILPALDSLLQRGFDRLSAESRRMALLLELKIELVLHCWLWLCVAAGGLKLFGLMALYPQVAPLADLPLLALPYLLVALAPVVGYRLATACFPSGRLLAQPGLRLARFGRWRAVPVFEASSAPSYGPGGIIVSLIGGLLISIVLRSGEYFVAIPAIPLMAPVWARTIIQVMTIDMVVMAFLYSVCFVMALRSVPYFPRMMVLTWCLDLTMQLGIASTMAATPDLPVEVAQALQPFVTGNLQKVLISVTLWLPYLLVSRRVNLTFRHRVRVRGKQAFAPQMALSA